MKKAIVLLIGAGLYVYFMQVSKDFAMSEMTSVQNLYTQAGVQAEAISSSNR